MRNVIVGRGLPMSLLLMAVAVILILSGSGATGLTFGLVVAGVGAVLLFSALIYDDAHGDDRRRRRGNRSHREPYASHPSRRPHARGY